MKLILSTLLLFYVINGCARTHHSETLELVPTFESCSMYFPAEPGSRCVVTYRETDGGAWREAYPPIYDTVRCEFRGSLVRLKENTGYTVRVELTHRGSRSVIQNSFTTWNSEVPVKKEIPVSTLYDTAARAVQIAGIRGSAEGWVKITGDVPIRAEDESEAAILIQDSKYVILEGLTVTGGYRHGILIKETCTDVRIVNCDISKWGRKTIRQNRNGHYLDREGKEINNDGGITLQKAKNVVVERCYIHDPNGYTNPWTGVVEFGEHRGEPYPWSHPQGPNGVYVMQSAGGFVLRYNDIVGGQLHRYNDPVEDWRNGDVEGGFNRDADIYGNLMAFGQDDGIELDGGQCNVRMYDNRIEQVFCGISTAPNKKGPSYVFDNLVWNLGNSNGAGSVAVKNGGGMDHSLGVTYVFNNTMVVAGNGMTGVGYGEDTPRNKRELFHAVTRNNIFHSLVPIGHKGKGSGLSISDRHRTPTNDFDYDLLGNSTTADGAGEIMAVEGSEAHGVFASPRFTDFPNCVFTLAADDPGRNRGVALPNFRESFDGPAPDIGAFPYGGSSLMPRRPIDIEADKYYVRLETGVPQVVTLTIGDVPAGEFELRRCEDMEWLRIESCSGEITPHSTLTLKLTAHQADHKRIGMLMVRLANGFSVPITVCAD